MALQGIEPKYQIWVSKMEGKNVNSVLTELKTEVEKLNDTILHSTSSDDEVQHTIKDVRKKLLYTGIYYNNAKLADPSQDWKKTDEEMDILSENIEIILNYEQRNILSKQQNSLSILTWLGIIFLPLTLITGYYGMNFNSMGSPSTNQGPFSWKYGQLWVLFLFVFSALLTIFVLKKFR
jgi:Mg2+ and Co2+ transporter CorA